MLYNEVLYARVPLSTLHLKQMLTFDSVRTLVRTRLNFRNRLLTRHVLFIRHK